MQSTLAEAGRYFQIERQGNRFYFLLPKLRFIIILQIKRSEKPQKDPQNLVMSLVRHVLTEKDPQIPQEATKHQGSARSSSIDSQNTITEEMDLSRDPNELHPRALAT